MILTPITGIYKDIEGREYRVIVKEINFSDNLLKVSIQMDGGNWFKWIAAEAFTEVKSDTSAQG